ncbi:MAG: glycosyltransferase [Oscillospiraceae bacterium]|nr:glycosyltransferase [Oscillospiraceae bacterium]
MSSIAVLIPCYNEQQTIAGVVADFRRALPDAAIYVYDNGSADETAARAEEAGAVVRREPKRGKGNVLRTMLRDIDADCYLLTDGDGTYSAEAAARMCAEVLERGADMVVGDRLSSAYFTQNKRRFHSAGNRMVKALVNLIFRSDVKDIMTGCRAFSPLFAKTFPVLSRGFEIETEMTIHALDKNLNIAEIPVSTRERPEGSQSKLNTFSDGVKVLLMIFKLYKHYRPLPFFGMLTALFAALSLGLFAPVFIEFLHTGLVRQFPTLIVSGFIMLAALLCLSCGLILDTIAQKARQDFEFKLTMTRMMMDSRRRKD